MKEKLIEKLKELHKEHSHVYGVLRDNARNPEEISKQLKIKLGMVTVKATFIEAQIYTLIEILVNQLDVDVTKELSPELYSLYYVIKNHITKELNISGDLLEIDPKIEEQLNKFKNGFKKE